MESLSPEIEKQLLKIVRDFLIELKADRAHLAVSLDAVLESDLGMGSLEKSELFYRLENAFSIALPTATLVEAKTLRDLGVAIQHAHPPQKITTGHTALPTLEEVNLDLSTTGTLVNVLLQHATQNPDRPHIYLQDEQGDEQVITYKQLLDNASAIAKGLQSRGLKSAETVAIMLPTSEAFFYAFFGVLLAGGIPVPIYPPFRPNRIEEYAKREAAILRNAEIRFLITFHRAESLSVLLRAFIPSLKEVVTTETLMTSAAMLTSLVIEPEDAALIQYTSGSTGAPKGVLLSHENLLSNIRAVGQAINIQPTDVVVSWLPLYHDMGLIGAWLGSLYHGIPVTILSPLSFLSRPEQWLWAIHYHRATLSAGPNFAYELCLRKIDDKAIEGLDLSSWRAALNGAEAVYPKTLERFTKRFAPYGFKTKTFFPVYGLAESAVALAFPPLGREPRVDRIKRDIFATEQRAVPANLGDKEKECLEFVCCGLPLPDHAIRIVDDKTGREVGERIVGCLQFSGPSAMQGYYRNPTATQAVYHEGWWDSGDYAYQADGEIFITGRKKDLIIKAGRNFYPEEIEHLVNQVDGVRKGCVVAFGVNDLNRGTEKLIIVAEVHEQQTDKRTQIAAQIIEQIVSGIEIPPDDVLLVKPGTIPKTSSGKLQRSGCKQNYLQGKLTRRRLPAWLQISKLFLITMGKKLGRGFNMLGRFFYTGYLALIIFVTALPLWLSIFYYLD